MKKQQTACTLNKPHAHIACRVDIHRRYYWGGGGGLIKGEGLGRSLMGDASGAFFM